MVTNHNDAPSPEAGVPVTHDEVTMGFAHVALIARQIIDRGRNWKRWVLGDRELVLSWTDGRTALLGDAAYPQQQDLAQGACMALQDAVAIATT